MSEVSTEMFKALGDPVRWSIVCNLADVDELDPAALEETLAIARPAIWYHLRILAQAGIVDVRRDGRNHYHSLSRPALEKLQDSLAMLVAAGAAVDRQQSA